MSVKSSVYPSKYQENPGNNNITKEISVESSKYQGNIIKSTVYTRKYQLNTGNISITKEILVESRKYQ